MTAVPYRGILLDLFGTLIAFETQRLPVLEVAGERLRTTVGGLRGALARWVPAATPEAFQDALVTVSDAMIRARAVDHVELPSRERFRRVLERLGCEDTVLPEAAAHVSRAHMGLISAATRLPEEHLGLLQWLRLRYRLGVVSNFDDTSAAYDILRRHGLLGFLDTVVVSEALGLRKPHPAPVRLGLSGLGLEAAQVLFVGDNFVEDVGAARNAGVDVAWIDAGGRGVPAGEDPPRYRLRALGELVALLEGR